MFVVNDSSWGIVWFLIYTDKNINCSTDEQDILAFSQSNKNTLKLILRTKPYTGCLWDLKTIRGFQCLLQKMGGYVECSKDHMITIKWCDCRDLTVVNCIQVQNGSKLVKTVYKLVSGGIKLYMGAVDKLHMMISSNYS